MSQPEDIEFERLKKRVADGARDLRRQKRALHKELEEAKRTNEREIAEIAAEREKAETVEREKAEMAKRDTRRTTGK